MSSITSLARIAAPPRARRDAALPQRRPAATFALTHLSTPEHSPDTDRPRVGVQTR
jgi:hypothetical protein